jgi:hypothetical protein
VGAVTVAEASVYPENDTFNGIKIIIESNYVHHNENRLVSWNPSKDFIHFVIDEGSGIFLTRNSDTYSRGIMLVANNLSYLNGASGIVVHYTDRAVVEENTCYLNGTTNGTSKAGGIGMNNVDSLIIRNNISWASPLKSALYKQGGELTRLNIQANILFNNNGPQDITSGIPDSGWIETDPVLINPQNFDFRLAINSPAIDNGIPDIYVSDDITGFRRDDNPDIGAYEYHSPSNVFLHTPNLLKLYPNPANNYIIVKLSNKTYKPIEIFNNQGKRILTYVKTRNKTKFKIDISNFTTGIYLLKVGNSTSKFIKY